MRRALKNYAIDRGKAFLIWDKVRASLERVITSLGRLIGALRHRALLHRRRKVHHLHLPEGNSPVYKYHHLSFSYHSNIADLLYFLTYATTDLVGSNNRRFMKMMACRPSGGTRENPQPPNNSWLKEIFTAC